jgi:hypothetical protein
MGRTPRPEITGVSIADQALHRSKSDPLISESGQNENPPFLSLWQLPPAADMPQLTEKNVLKASIRNNLTNNCHNAFVFSELEKERNKNREVSWSSRPTMTYYMELRASGATTT